MLFFHLLVTFFSPNQIFQQKRLLPNQAFVISLCNLILFLAVHFSLLKLLIYKFLFVQTLHIKMTKKLNVNQPLCTQLFCRYMHVNAAIPLVCTVELRIFFRVLFFTYTILFDWKKMLTDMSSHHLSILFSHLPGSKNNEYTPVLTVNLRQNVHMQKPLLSFLSVEFASN